MEPSSIISHVSIGTNDYAKAIAFYDALLLPLGIQKIMEHDDATAYGREFPEFWVQVPEDGQSASVGNGVHIGFMLQNREAVDQFYTLAIEAGATDAGAPGPRAHYGEEYYGCFVRDLDGNKIEGMHWGGEGRGDSLYNVPATSCP